MLSPINIFPNLDWHGIGIEDTWPKQLERGLNERAGAGDFEVLNGGLPATDTWQHEIDIVSGIVPDTDN